MSGEFAGLLVERIAIDRAVSGRTAGGLDESNWLQTFTCRARISNNGSGPVEVGQAFSRMPRIRMVLRSGWDVHVGDRVRWNERVFRIDEVNADPRSPDRIELHCEEIRA